ncbi:MAG TPA: hypothetical protein VIC29_07325 [Steroidobacteraceae bacterium]|jgi:phage shock protein A
MAVVNAAAMADQTQSLESRVTRLESDVSYIRSDIGDIKLDIRELRKEMAELRDRLTRGLASNRIGMLLQSAAILGVMARGFKWI